MTSIIIEHNPDATRLSELGVAKWPTWSKEVSVFPFTFDDQETAYVLEGDCVITPDSGGKPVNFWCGRLTNFPRRFILHLGSKKSVEETLFL